MTRKKSKNIVFPRQYKYSVFMDWLIKNWIKEDCDKYIERLFESEVKNAKK